MLNLLDNSNMAVLISDTYFYFWATPSPSNINLTAEINVSNDYVRKKSCSSDVSSTSDRSSSPSVNACEKESQIELQNSRILDKLHDIEILIHQEKINNTKNFIDLQNEIIKLNVKNKKLVEDNTYLYDQLYDIDYKTY